MRLWIGRSILFVAAIHLVFGVIFFGDAFVSLLRTGVLDSVTIMSRSATATAFWFFIAGLFALMLGGMVAHLERLGSPFPAFLPWSLLAVTLLGCALMPVSAWWLLLAPVAGMFVRARRMSANRRAELDS